MNSLFMFPWDHKGLEFRVLFKGPGNTPTPYFEEAIKSAAQAVLYPDGIIILGLLDDADDLNNAIKDDTFKASLRRLAGKAGVYLALLQRDYKSLSITTISDNPRSDFVISMLRDQEVFSKLLNAGLVQAFRSERLVLPAPPGYHFQKPSGDASSHFIKAEEALSQSEIVDFLALVLLIRLGRKENLKVIYIDTMGISSLAYALREMMRSTTESSVIPRIVSFHSHEGLDEISAPIPGTAYCIISASSSLSLEKRWREKTNCADNEVVTLLTFKDTRDGDKALFQLDRPNGWAEHNNLISRGTKGMRTLGERFQQEQILPKKVTLTRDYHPSEEAQDISSSFWKQDFLDVDVGAPDGKRRTLHGDGRLLVKQNIFKDWLKKQVRANIPASIQGIIYQDDPSSKLLAKKCRDLLREFSISLDWGIHSSSDYESKLKNLDQERALLIVAAVVGQGHTILGVSRDLRPCHIGSKIYIVGMQICETAREQHFLKTNLANTKDGTNRFLSWKRLATGSGLRLSLEHERSMRTDAHLRSLLLTRHSRQVNVGLSSSSLLPTAPEGEALQLRKDFLFWPEGYTPGARHAPLVLATIGAILERARTDASLIERARNVVPLPENHRLSSETFQQVLLDPQNFNRFNDGIVQAALLRQALPSELDYSCTHEESGFMRDFLIKVFLSRDKPQGEAALEFAFAIATRRLKIQDRDLLFLKEKVFPTLNNKLIDLNIKRFLDRATETDVRSADF